MNHNLLIRHAIKSDGVKLASLFLNSRRQNFTWQEPETFSIDDYAKSVQDDIVHVAEINRAIAGFISIYQTDNFIHNLFVDESFKNQGVGKALLNKALEILNKPITLKVITHNLKACSFYESQGFTIFSTDIVVDPPYHLYIYK